MSNLTTPIVLDDDSGLDKYEQVRSALATRIADGSLAAGTRLPTVRALAADLSVAPHTVARAYRELEQAGLVDTRGRAGTVVSAGGDRAVADAVTAAERFVATTRALGVADDVALGLVRSRLDTR